MRSGWSSAAQLPGVATKRPSACPLSGSFAGSNQAPNFDQNEIFFLDFKLSGGFHTRDSNQDVVSVAGEARAKIFPSLVLHVGVVAMMMAFAFMRFKPVQTSFPKSGTNRDQFFRSAYPVTNMKHFMSCVWPCALWPRCWLADACQHEQNIFLYADWVVDSDTPREVVLLFATDRPLSRARAYAADRIQSALPPCRTFAVAWKQRRPGIPPVRVNANKR